MRLFRRISVKKKHDFVFFFNKLAYSRAYFTGWLARSFIFKVNRSALWYLTIIVAKILIYKMLQLTFLFYYKMIKTYKINSINHSIVIPIGVFSFFAYANTKNIFEYTDGKKIDLVFVTSNEVSESVKKSLEKIKKEFPIRVLTAPFNAGSNHLRLLDWAIREPSINEWMITQHCDVFWKRNDWLSNLENNMQDGIAAICPPNYQFDLDGKLMPLIGDCFGAYNKKIISERKWSFQWNWLNEKSVSHNVRKLISEGRLNRIKDTITFADGDFLDGSVIMSLEMIAENSEMIRTVPTEGLYHLLAFFRIYDAIHWIAEKQTLNINLPFLVDYGGCPKNIWIDAFTKFSFLTSFYFDRKEVKKPLPWSLLSKISLIEQIDLDVFGATSTCDWIGSYHKIKSNKTLGMKDLNIKKIKFDNKEYNFD